MDRTAIFNIGAQCIIGQHPTEMESTCLSSFAGAQDLRRWAARSFAGAQDDNERPIRHSPAVKQMEQFVGINGNEFRPNIYNRQDQGN
jgi:hypothetical protein